MNLQQNYPPLLMNVITLLCETQTCVHLFITTLMQAFPFSALTLLVGRQEGHLVHKKTGCWFVGGDDLTGALHDL